MRRNNATNPSKMINYTVENHFPSIVPFKHCNALSLGLGLGYSSGGEPNSESDPEDELVFTRCPIFIPLLFAIKHLLLGHLTKMLTDMALLMLGIPCFIDEYLYSSTLLMTRVNSA